MIILFRKDLYARISTFELHIKPLRERKRDVVPIIMSLGESLKMVGKAKEFIEKYEQQILDDKLSLDLNVRSLEQFVKRYNLWGRP